MRKRKENPRIEEINFFDELDHLNTGDERITKRVIKTLNTLYKKPGEAVSAASSDAGEAKAIYRLLGNAKFKKEALLEAHKIAVIKKIQEEEHKIILVPEDTSDLDYTGLKETKGLGNRGDSTNEAKGLIMHSAIALTEEGVAIGLLGQKIWSRENYKKLTSNEKKNLPIEEKESFKWIETMDEVSKGMPKDVQVINICDREGDIYELFARANEKKQNFIVRAAQNRKTTGEYKSFEKVKKSEIAGSIVVHIPRDTKNNKPEREATLSIKYVKIQLQKPKNLKDYPDYTEVTLVLAEEENPPKGTESISWHLLTNLEVNTFEDAVKIVKYYVHRWKIERFHFVLKSGMNVEKIQSSTADRLMKMITLLSLIAIKILTITYFSREYPDTTCEEFFSKDEWALLYCVVNQTNKLPKKTPSIKEVTYLLARLGGFLARKNDGNPRSRSYMERYARPKCDAKSCKRL